MNIPLTDTQKQRLIELDADQSLLHRFFDSTEERDHFFREQSKPLVQKNRERLEQLREKSLRPALRALESMLVEALTDRGFIEVVTPTTLSKGMLERMGIVEGHPLRDQVYWVDRNVCLRPMLAPNLYHVMGRLGKIWGLPVKIFEVGQCFRKESKGSKHLSEFTMLNLVQMGIDTDPQHYLEGLIPVIMGPLEMNYSLGKETSGVYGTTTDVIIDGMEVASGATGPHPLDSKWDIADNWAGLGFGLERLVMAKEGFTNIRRAGRSLIYLDGARLNI